MSRRLVGLRRRDVDHGACQSERCHRMRSAGPSSLGSCKSGRTTHCPRSCSSRPRREYGGKVTTRDATTSGFRCFRSKRPHVARRPRPPPLRGACDGGADRDVVGFLRLGPFWDQAPLMNLLWVLRDFRCQGFAWPWSTSGRTLNSPPAMLCAHCDRVCRNIAALLPTARLCPTVAPCSRPTNRQILRRWLAS
jgi:hypothetical protein